MTGTLLIGQRAIAIDSVMARAAQAASALASLGVRAGDIVAVYLRNDPAFFEASYAAGLLGAYSTPVNWHYKPAEAAYLFRNSGARALVIHADLFRIVRDVIPEDVAAVVVETPSEIGESYGIAQENRAVPAGVRNWSQWIADFPPWQQPRESPGSVIYTSGTTGFPKGVRRAPPTPEQAVASRRTQATVFGFGLVPTDEMVTVITGPMYHSAPNAYGLLSGRMKAKVILQPKFDAEGLLALIEEHRVTHLHMVPIMFNRLLRLPEATRRRHDLSSLRFVVHAAAPCPAPVKRAMIDWWGPVIGEYYGSTETGPLTFCNSAGWLAHPGSVGRPLPGVEIRVLDPLGAAVADGEVGEIVGRNTLIADFTYHDDADKRQDADKSGLVAAGDIGYFDADGYLYLCDRAKDMIISGGVNIYPAEIEAELQKMAGVADCAVFGIPDEEFGEQVCAVVQPLPGTDLIDHDVKAYLRAHISGFKVPKRVEVRDELPREDSGKIFKRKLREPFWEGVDRRI
jgi:long-chain acyl-CoA synthetase